MDGTETSITVVMVYAWRGWGDELLSNRTAWDPKGRKATAKAAGETARKLTGAPGSVFPPPPTPPNKSSSCW